MSVTVKHLRAFVSVARTGSFTNAAGHLAISQPALTMAIRQLEDSVGASLFERTTRRVTMTAEGSDFLPTAERLVHDFDVAVQDIRIAARMRRGRVGIASVNSVAANLLPVALRGFSETHQAVSVYLRDGNSSEVRQSVRRNQVDIGFASRDKEDPELDFRPLFRDQMGILAHPEHPLLSRKRPLRWSDLAGYDFLGLALDTATRPILESVPGLAPAVTSPRYEVSNNATLEAMVAAGIGVTTGPALQACRPMNPLVAFRPLSDPVMWRTVFSITRRGRSLSPSVLDILSAINVALQTLAKRNPLIESIG